MERKESAHALQLIKFGAIRLKGRFSTFFMGTFAMVTPLILIVLVPFIMSMLLNAYWILTVGIVLFVILVGPMQVGYIKYFNAILEGKQPSIGLIYSGLRFSVFTLKTIYIATLLILMYLVGGILWIIPAGFAVSFYSMTLFFQEKFNYPRLSQAFNDCSAKMIGNRLLLLSYKLIFYFVYALIFAIGALCLGLVYILATESLIVSWLIAVCSTIVFVFMYTMITVYYHSCNQVFFEDVLICHDKKQQLKVEKATKLNKTNEEKEQKNLNLEQNKEKEVKGDIMKATNKSAKKTPVSTGSAKKPAAKAATKKGK